MNSNNILKTDYLDILFEGRNKQYGGYELRTKYNRRVTIATIGTLVLTAALFLGKALADRSRPEVVKAPPPPMVEVELKEPPPMDEKNEPPPPPAPPAPPPPVRPTVVFTPPVIKDKEDIKEDEKPATQEELKENVAGPENKVGNPNADELSGGESGDGKKGVIEEEKKEDVNAIVTDIDRPASFEGLYAFLGKNLQYPEAEREQGNAGKVFVQFVVNVDGSIQDVKVAKSSGHEALDKEAIRVIRSMNGKWSAAEKAGKKVRTVFKQPVTFRLD